MSNPNIKKDCSTVARIQRWKNAILWLAGLQWVYTASISNPMLSTAIKKLFFCVIHCRAKVNIRSCKAFILDWWIIYWQAMNLCHFLPCSPDSNYTKSHGTSEEKEARNINREDPLLKDEHTTGLCECQVVPWGTDCSPSDGVRKGWFYPCLTELGS